jgi:hypothetical protein
MIWNIFHDSRDIKLDEGNGKPGGSRTLVRFVSLIGFSVVVAGGVAAIRGS